MKRWVVSCLFGLAPVVGSVVVLAKSTEARDVTLQAARSLFGFFTTPFILETTIAIVGLLTVLTINEYRRKKEEADEWIIMPKEEGQEEAEQK